MGVSLNQVELHEWICSRSNTGSTLEFLERIESQVGHAIDTSALIPNSDASVRLGSYTSYGVFRLCLEWIFIGNPSDRLDEDEDIEQGAVLWLESRGVPCGKGPFAELSHILGTGDTDTVFIPYEMTLPAIAPDGESFVGSTPAAMRAMLTFAEAVGFEMDSDYDPEEESGNWVPIATAANICRTMYAFFKMRGDRCIALG